MLHSPVTSAAVLVMGGCGERGSLLLHSQLWVEGCRLQNSSNPISSHSLSSRAPGRRMHIGSQVKQAEFRVCFQEVRAHEVERASPEGGHPLCGQSWSPHPPPGGVDRPETDRGSLRNHLNSHLSLLQSDGGVQCI